MRQAKGFVGRILPHKKDSRSEKIWTQALPFLALILYWVTGGTVFYLLQKYATGLTVSFASEYYEPDGRCSDSTVMVPFTTNKTRVFGEASFGRAFFYVSTIYSSIGYGTTAPCTWVGKLLTMIFASTGVPLTLLCLGRLGRFLRQLLDKIWNQMVLKREPSVVTLDETHIPLYVGIFITGIWITLTAYVFWHAILTPAEPGESKRLYPQSWTYFDALYFTVISFFTIGLGDYAPEQYFLNAVHFSFIFIGLSLVSMCISIAQLNMESQFDKMVTMIQHVYEQQQKFKDVDGLSDGGRHSPFNPQDENAARLVLALWGNGPTDFASMFKRPRSDSKTSSRHIGPLMTRLMVDQWKRKALNKTKSTQTQSLEVVRRIVHSSTLPDGFCIVQSPHSHKSYASTPSSYQTNTIFEDDLPLHSCSTPDNDTSPMQPLNSVSHYGILPLETVAVSPNGKTHNAAMV